ncbi:MAG: LPS export ABC transporter permease LptF [Alphaproteobacteria bacterium]|nr:LPS export ABC transporter permease LptF [Alphaproteobacteria bacterium]
MYRYSKYIARQLVHSTLLITFSLTSIVWLTQALRFIDFIVNQGVSIAVFVKLTLLLVPSLILMILPPALFCAILFSYNKLKTDSELLVMQAVGLSKWRLAVPALQVAAVITVIGYAIALYILPVSYREFRDMQSFLRNNYVSILLQEGVFSNPVEGLTVFTRERDKDGTMRGILVQDNRQRDQPVTMMAEEGKLVQTAQGPRFLLTRGNRQEMRDGKFSFLDFQAYTLDISLYTKDAGKRIVDPQELFVLDLFKPDETISQADNMRRFAEGHQRLIWPFYSLALAFVAVAVMLSGEFNRRGHWQRIVLASVLGVVVVFSAVGLRGAMALNPAIIPVGYLNVLLPCAIALLVLFDKWPSRRAPKISARVS